MKNKNVICITSLAKKTRVTVRIGRKSKWYLLPSIDAAKEFILARGNNRTSLRLNGYPCVLNGWVQ